MVRRAGGRDSATGSCRARPQTDRLVAEAATVARGTEKQVRPPKLRRVVWLQRVVAALARRDAATATDASTCGLAAQAAATAADRRAEPYLHAAPNGADLITRIARRRAHDG